ncbi:hypothetical protein ESA_01375 [Cronobacter sakazakii ATCC BAA-894]|uniref:Uncharacterized protein n=1 Tax=Cronobacter sakazakii (strain ATCC BAA-894) TaxID=290339 RepID=A7MEB5_CROS8|nr:hypothetical protein ESA_01375 [Cronobacter sakazakii ATCC BAA-894]
MSLLDEKRGLLYWKFRAAISPKPRARAIAVRKLALLTKFNKNRQPSGSRRQ